LTCTRQHSADQTAVGRYSCDTGRIGGSCERERGHWQSTKFFEAIVERIPAPKPTGAPTVQALGFDSYFDTYKGVVTHVRVFNGELKPGMQVKLLHSGKNVEIKRSAALIPSRTYVKDWKTGETGYMTANIKSPQEVKMGDTITTCGIRRPYYPVSGNSSMVFSGIYPINTADYEHLKANLGKLQLNDSAFVYQPETSVRWALVFRCGFLGLLHLEIVQERLRREYGMDIIATYPSVIYHVTLTDGNGQGNRQPGILARTDFHRKHRRTNGESVRDLSK